jgi:hypothetical protein
LRPLFGLSQSGEVLDRADPAPGLAGQEFQRAGDREMASALAGMPIPEADLGGALASEGCQPAQHRKVLRQHATVELGQGQGAPWSSVPSRSFSKALPVSCWQWAS